MKIRIIESTGKCVLCDNIKLIICNVSVKQHSSICRECLSDIVCGRGVAIKCDLFSAYLIIHEPESFCRILAIDLRSMSLNLKPVSWFKATHLKYQGSKIQVCKA